jgi:altronate dehydratase
MKNFIKVTPTAESANRIYINIREIAAFEISSSCSNNTVIYFSHDIGRNFMPSHFITVKEPIDEVVGLIEEATE